MKELGWVIVFFLGMLASLVGFAGLSISVLTE